ncbi:hypothetical protein, partial [Nocardia wallacei]|uniref:hypothetical protein n=1 Tax=Nocardia wallacei TaxID=480035 RepID=UPI0024565B17
SDWDERLRDWGGLPEMYQPLVDLAEAVFAQQEPVPLVSYLLAKHPHPGGVLFQVMLWREKRRLPAIIGQLTMIPAVLDGLVRMIIDAPQGRRQLRICEQLVKAGKRRADPVLQAIIAEHPQIQEVLRYSDRHAPLFTSRMAELTDAPLFISRMAELLAAGHLHVPEDPAVTRIREMIADVRNITGARHRLPGDAEHQDDSTNEIPVYITEPNLSPQQRDTTEEQVYLTDSEWAQARKIWGAFADSRSNSYMAWCIRKNRAQDEAETSETETGTE